MQKIWTVARHEYLNHLRRRGFLISTFGMPIGLILLFGLIIVVIVSTSQVKAIGYVDESSLFQTISPRLSWRSGLGEVEMQRFPDLATATEQLKSGAVDAVFVIPKDYVNNGQVDGYALEALPALAETSFTQFLQAGVANALFDETSERVIDPIARLDSAILDAPPGEARRALLSSFIPLLFGVIVLGATFASGSYLMMAVAEEKEQRIMEILASSLSPYQMMAGKIIGLGGLAITQLFIWTSGGACLLIWGAAKLGLIGQTGVAPGVLVLGLMLFFPMYFIIAATLSAIGAAVSSVQQGQQLTGVVTLMCTLPLWFLPILANRPNGGLAIVLNLIPYTAPVTLLQRVTSSAVPLWQQIATVVWLWIASALLMRISGRIVRVGLLRYGQRLSLRDIRKAIWR
ncbi:MAG: ABC transporter permease [Herpetosiphonaceae bacterium]|nr:ABC transporter permease [Herpetosiphonaceae bacterium]